jgi:serine/threonine protein kinase
VSHDSGETMELHLNRESQGVDEDLRRRYEEAWRSGSRPALEAFLPGPDSPGRLVTLIELACIEIEQSWKRSAAGGGTGEPNSIEDYLQRFPELRTPLAMKQLIEQELLMRSSEGQSADPGEYAGRFPDACAMLDTLSMEASQLASHGVGSIHISSDALLSRSFGSYELLECVGEGGMGWVYRARHQRLGSLAAVKVLKDTAGDAGDVRLRFQREGRAAANLRHPNLAMAFDAGDEGPWSYIVFEFVEGENLRQMVTRDGPLTEAAAVGYIRQAAAGLAHVHGHGFVHRDVKPANLMVDRGGQIKVLDLGLASARANTDWTDVTTLNVLMGTVDYMAPEQGIDPRLADARTDIYSLGCTLFFLLTGKPMYAGGTCIARLVAHREHAIPTLRTHCPQISQDLDCLFGKMVAKRPQDRFACMGDVISALDAIDFSLDANPNESLPIGRWLKIAIAGCAVVAVLTAALTPMFLAKDSADGLAPPPNTQVALPGENVHRQRAHQILQIGGSLDAIANGRPITVVSADEIPRDPFDITGLSLGGDNVSEEAVIAVLPLPGLKNLGLCGCQLTTGGLEQIAQLAPDVESVNLGGVDLAKVDLSSLRQLQHLHTLWIGRTGIGDEAMDALTQVASLQYLWIGETSITDEGVRRLPLLQRLHGVGLEYTQVTGNCLPHLEKLQLGTLLLDGNPISDEDIDSLGQLKTLRGLSLHGTKITDEGLVRLGELLPQCEISR